MLLRIISLIIKEFWIILRDPKERLVLIVPPLVQLLIFGFAVTLEVKNVSVLIYNNDNGYHSQEIIKRLAGSETFSKIYFTDNYQEFQKQLNEQKVMAAISIPQNFSQKIESRQSAVLQIIYDGRKSNTTQIANAYLSQVINQYNLEILAQQNNMPKLENLKKINIETRHWFNENLNYLWFTMPSLVAILAIMITIILTSMSLAREKELGTFNQLLVSPLKPIEILLGKMVPAMIIGTIEGLLIFVISTVIFGVPFRGSFILLVLGIIIFTYSIVGFGLFISTWAKTQQQASLGIIMFMVPAISLSGFAAPIENMPIYMQKLVWLNPIKHALIIFKGCFLKDISTTYFLANAWPLLAIGSFTFLTAFWFFKKNI